MLFYLLFGGFLVFLIFNYQKSRKAEHTYYANKVYNDLKLEDFFVKTAKENGEVRDAAIRFGLSQFKMKVVSHLERHSYVKKLKAILNDTSEDAPAFTGHPETKNEISSIANEVIKSVSTREFASVKHSEVSARRRRR